ELKSRPTRAHPLFRAFIGAALNYNAAERLPVEIPDEPGEIEAIDAIPAKHPTGNGVVVGAAAAAG
ncbi:MAG TPA: hypothetical protein VIM17_02090, partial [Jatrophihabitantaceae bacterium]